MLLQDMGGADCAEEITSSEKNKDILCGLDSNQIYELAIVEGDVGTAFEDFQVREGDDLGWLGHFIGQCTSLTTLEIWDFPGDADQINKFIEGLNHNRSIRALRIDHDRGDEMLEKLSNFFINNKRIDILELRNFDIGHESARKLASTICDVPLKDLSLCGNELSIEGFEEIVIAASSMRARIKSLRVECNNVGQVGCTTLLRSGVLNKLKDLDLEDNSIDDNSLQTLAAGLVNNTTLEELSLGGNPSITANGLRYLIPYLQSESCSLSSFFLYRINFGDAGAAALVHGLGKNESLKRLWFNPATCGMSSAGWQSFATLLCDTSSINNTYKSNHTIELIGESCNVGSPINQVHELVRDLLRMNGNAYSRDIAKCKILLYHRDLDVEPVFKWDLKFLPLMISWFGKIHECDMLPSIFNTRCSELSMVYKFIRGMPPKKVECYWQQFVTNAQAKRQKIEDETRRLDRERLRLHHEEEAAWVRLGGRPRIDGSSANRVGGSKRMRQE